SVGRRAGPPSSSPARLSTRGCAWRDTHMSDPRVAIFVAALLVLFLAATAQAALVYIDRARLRHMLEEGTPRASALMRLLDEQTSTLSTILVVYTLSLCVAAATAFWFDLELWLSVAPWAAVVAALIELLALMLIQFLGRVVAVSRPEQVALTF